MSKHQHIRNHY